MIKFGRPLVALLALILIAAATGFVRPAAAQIPYTSLLWSEPRYAAVVIDANTGEVLYTKHPDSPRYPASITKIMTLYLTFEALSAGRLSLSDTLVVSPYAASMAPTKLGLSPGSTITVDEAMRAVAVKSANDMAVALAERIGGTEARFAALMTLRAQELGMANTQFVNASGLPDSRQLSSARDIAILSRSVMRDYPQYYSYFSLHSFAYRGETMNNHNHLLDSMPGVDGLKTGFTNASGFNLAASAVQDGRRLIAVVMGGSSSSARDANVADLLNTGFDVLRRRDRGETITVAQNLFEPEPSGPILRPQLEQGDADQHGGKGVGTDGDEDAQPIHVNSMRALLAPPTRSKSCSTSHEVSYVRGRHHRRTRVVTSHTHCVSERPYEEVVNAAAAPPEHCHTIKVRQGRGRHSRLVSVRRCDAGAPEEVADASDAPVEHHAKSADRGGWFVQVGAFRSRSDARIELAKLGRRFSGQFADAEANVGGAVGGMFRARFMGLSAEAAKDACSLLRSHRMPCVANAGS